MSNKIKLPGARRFAAYLRSVADGSPTVEGPEIVDKSHNGKYAKRWTILLDGEVLGEYYTFGPKPGEKDFGREYRGRIPGYVNECLVIWNTYRGKTEDKVPVDTVGLVFSDSRFEANCMYEWHEKGPGRIVQTAWQRQDGVDIPEFP